jgi:hypothetical protein
MNICRVYPNPNFILVSIKARTMVYLVTLDTGITILQTKGYSPVMTDDKDRLTSSQIY